MPRVRRQGSLQSMHQRGRGQLRVYTEVYPLKRHSCLPAARTSWTGSTSSKSAAMMSMHCFLDGLHTWCGVARGRPKGRARRAQTFEDVAHLAEVVNAPGCFGVVSVWALGRLEEVPWALCAIR